MDQRARSATPRAFGVSQLSRLWLSWSVVVVALVALWLPMLAENFRALANPPVAAEPALSDAMISAQAHAVYHLALDLLFGFGCIAVSAVLLRVSQREPFAVSAAFVLCGWGLFNGLAAESAAAGGGWSWAVCLLAWAAWIWLVARSVQVYRSAATLRVRQQVKWLWYGAATSAVLMLIVAAAVGTSFTLDADQIDRHMTGHLLLVISGSAFPAGLWTAWGRESVPDPDTLIRRTLVYGVLTAIVAGVTISLVFLPALLYYELGPVYLLMVVCAWAVLGLPLQQFVQRVVNRMLYGQREEPMAVLTALGERLELGSPETMLNTIVETVATTLKLPAVAIRSAEDGSELASVGRSELPTVTLPIVHQSEAVGELVVSIRARDEPLHDHDYEILRLVARQAGPTVKAVQLNQELRRSRREILLSREEERRRIRRDLHDGLGPALAAIAMQADTARAVVDDDPALARELLNAVTRQSEDVVHEVRRLVYDLRPPALDQLGLLGAVESLAQQNSSATLRVAVTASGALPALDAAVEVAVYRIVSEALTNVVRHAGATHCEVRFETSSPELQVVIEDDGAGINENARAGIGLRSMAERAAEVGGGIAFDRRSPNGTRVALTMPVHPSLDEADRDD